MRWLGPTLLVVVLPACSKSQMLDLAMASAPRHHAPSGLDRDGATHAADVRYQLLAGDMHCHILPPDSPAHVSRDLPETVRRATDEGLDFVVLTPHAPARFFLDPEMRAWVRRTQEALRTEANALSARGGPHAPVLVPGMEYTDHRFGHVGLAFADVAEVLDELPLDDALATPSRFFEAWRAHGGIATINHPMLRPIPQAIFMELRYDMSWRGIDIDGSATTREAVFPEIRWLSAHADAIETYNVTAAHLRDRWVLGDSDWTMREGSHLVDRVARKQERRVAPVGGSDSHGGWLRATTFVLATARTAPAIRDAIVHGRTCVRGPEGCSFEARGSDGVFQHVGAAITTSPTRRSIEVRARGGESSYVVNGTIAAIGGDGETVTIPTSGTCTTVRAVVGSSASASVYVDCPWAAAREN
jgi:hypothetical protein